MKRTLVVGIFVLGLFMGLLASYGLSWLEAIQRVPSTEVSGITSPVSMGDEVCIWKPLEIYKTIAVFVSKDYGQDIFLSFGPCSVTMGPKFEGTIPTWPTWIEGPKCIVGEENNKLVVYCDNISR